MRISKSNTEGFAPDRFGKSLVKHPGAEEPQSGDVWLMLHNNKCDRSLLMRQTGSLLNHLPCFASPFQNASCGPVTTRILEMKELGKRFIWHTRLTNLWSVSKNSCVPFRLKPKKDQILFLLALRHSTALTPYGMYSLHQYPKALFVDRQRKWKPEWRSIALQHETSGKKQS